MASFDLPGPSYATADLCVFYAGGEDDLRTLVNNNNDPSQDIDTARLQTACDSAQAIVDPYVGKQKAVPLVVAPLSIAHVTARIAIYQLRASRRMVDPDTHGAQNTLDMKYLEDIRDGVISLGTEFELPKAASRLDGQYQIPEWKPRSRLKLGGFG